MAEQKFKATGSSTLSSVDNKKRKEVLVSSSFDEQLQFTNANGAFLSNIQYTLALEDGAIVEGITDKKGRTNRIRTGAPIAIKNVKLQPVIAKIPARATAKSGAHSCTAHPAGLPDFLVMEINGIKTNSFQIGTSVAPVVTPDDGARGLTAGEISMAKVLFHDSIDYAKVKVHNGDFLWLGMQENDTAITPNGELYFPKGHFEEDFSKSREALRLWFMHEMVHVWQYQLGYPVLIRGALYFGLDYKYVLEENKLLYDYNMEAQGDLLSDYWALLDSNIRGKRIVNMHRPQYVNDIKLFEHILRQFLKDPSRSINLPFG